MDFNKRSKKVKEVANVIIDHQFDDTKEYSIDNHFLISVVNRMVRSQADKIKGFADFIFEHCKTNNIKKLDDRHNIKCEILKNTDELSVLVINDETIYGPNLQHIIVIDDKKSGKFHIRKLKNPTLAVGKYVANKFQVPGDSFVTEGFIMTYDYYPVLMRNFKENVDMKELSPKQLETFNDIRKTEDMGDNTFHLYECVVYSASLLGCVKRYIKNEN